MFACKAGKSIAPSLENGVVRGGRIPCSFMEKDFSRNDTYCALAPKKKAALRGARLFPRRNALRRSSLLSFVTMQVLQRRNGSSAFVHRANSSRRRNRRRQRGDARQHVTHGRATNRFFVVKRLAAQRRIDNQIHFAR